MAKTSTLYNSVDLVRSKQELLSKVSNDVGCMNRFVTVKIVAQALRYH